MRGGGKLFMSCISVGWVPKDGLGGRRDNPQNPPERGYVRTCHLCTLYNLDVNIGFVIISYHLSNQFFKNHCKSLHRSFSFILFIVIPVVE